MKWKPALLLPLILALGSCASEGGSRGSGISTEVTGNVASVQTAAAPGRTEVAAATRFGPLRALFHLADAARAATALEGIHVTIDGSTAAGDTDAEGQFSLSGDFEGLVSLVFERASDGLVARMPLNVPAAGKLTLNNLHIDALREEATAETQSADFEGVITGVSCGGLTLTMRSVQQDPNDLDRYTVRIDTSSVQDAHGNALTCNDLHPGQQALVQRALVNADGTFGGGVVQLEQ